MDGWVGIQVNRLDVGGKVNGWMGGQVNGRTIG